MTSTILKKTIVLGLEYQGHHWHGWQIQPDKANVQATLENALSIVANEPIKVICAGRTDAGVHATGQVVHLTTTAVRPLTAWVRGVNTHLPSSIAVQWAKEVDDSFHARFSATARTYHYLLYTSQTRSAIWANRAGFYHQVLDVEKMREAAQYLVGTHDFSAFRAQECQANSPIRTLSTLTIEQSSLSEQLVQGQFFCFKLTANAFLQHMVRNIIGSLIFVGNGKKSPEWINTILLAKDRKLAAPTFSPDGLYLVGVDYNQQWEIPYGNSPALMF